MSCIEYSSKCLISGETGNMADQRLWRTASIRRTNLVQLRSREKLYVQIRSCNALTKSDEDLQIESAGETLSVLSPSTAWEDKMLCYRTHSYCQTCTCSGISQSTPRYPALYEATKYFVPLTQAIVPQNRAPTASIQAAS